MEKPVKSISSETALNNLLKVKLDLVNLLWTEHEVSPSTITKSVNVLNGFCELLDIQAAVKESYVVLVFSVFMLTMCLVLRLLFPLYCLC